VNVGNDREVSVLDVARYVTELVPGSRIAFAPPVPQDPTNRCPDLTLLRQVLPNWVASTNYEEGVRLTLDWFRNQLDGKTHPPLAPEPVRIHA
jgi:UDP-glucose 4-epimerase/UDP-glucuronate decarboxylase